MKTFLNELKERNVVRVGAVYLGTAWLITHVGTILGENFEFPHWVMRSVIVFLALGFPVALGFAWVYEATPEGLKRTSEVAPARSIAQVTGRKLDRAIILVLALVVAALIADRFVLHESTPGRLVLPWSGEATVYGTAIVIGVVALLAATLVLMRIGRKWRTASAAATAASPTATLAHADERVSLAVLPFVNMSSDAEQEYFSDGLSEELMNKLAQVKKLRVAARTSCFAFKGQNVDMKVVSEKLGVGHVLEGSVRKAGNRLRITAQLIDCADGSHLWSQTFDRELDDVFAIQENVARAVADALGVTLGIGESVRAPGGTKNVEAYDKYLRARALFNSLQPKDLDRAAEIYREVIASDPSFTRARSGLAEAYYYQLIYTPERNAATVQALEAAVADALARAPDDWSTQFASAILCLQRREWAEAERAYTLAAERAPASDPGLSEFRAWMLLQEGRNRDAVALLQATTAIDPLSVGRSFLLQTALFASGRAEAAEAEYQRSLDLAGQREAVDHLALMRIWASGDTGLVQSRFDRYLSQVAVPLPTLGAVRKVFDNAAAALALLRTAAEDPANRDSTRQMLLGLYAGHYGDAKLALACFRLGMLDRLAGWGANAMWWPDMAAARREPGFKQLVRDLGLFDYWRSSGKWPDLARPLGTDDFECQ